MLTHDELIDSLALLLQARDHIIFKNFALGSPMNQIWLPVADLIAIKKSFTSFHITIYEVKANRPDFLQEMRSEKWRKYLPHCNQFYFAIQRNVADIKEIPPEAGIMFYHNDFWRRRREGAWRKLDFREYERLMLLKAMIIRTGSEIKPKRFRFSTAGGADYEKALEADKKWMEIDKEARLKMKEQGKDIGAFFRAWRSGHLNYLLPEEYRKK